MVKEIKLNKIQIQSIKESISHLNADDTLPIFSFDEGNGIVHFKDAKRFVDFIDTIIDLYEGMVYNLEWKLTPERQKEVNKQKKIIYHLQSINGKAIKCK